MNKTYVIGALGRSQFRRSLQAGGVSYVEDKGILDSQFVVDATPEQHRIIIKWINTQNYRSEFTYFTFKVKNSAAAEYADYLSKFSDAEVTSMKKGWFKTRFDVYCHPHLGKEFLDAEANFNS